MDSRFTDSSASALLTVASRDRRSTPGDGWGAGFVGRADESEAIARCRAEAVKGVPWVVVVEGDSGIGKTTLVRHALVPGEDGLQVCWATCDRAEQDYPYGVLDQMLRRLPSDNVGAAKLVSSLTPTATPLSVGADLLEVLAVATDAAPLALVVDDVPWADSQSLAALGFVLRRLFVEPVLTVFTARADAEGGLSANGAAGAHLDGGWRDRLPRGTDHLLSLRLTGLDAAEAGQLAAEAGVHGLGPDALQRLTEHTAGHPLHLRSLLSQTTTSELADLSLPLPVPQSLDAVIRQSLDSLPAQARSVVEALAVLDATVPLALVAQLAEVEDATSSLEPALASRLVQWEPDRPTTPLRIHHQLQREAVYQAIAPTRRRALHAVAATLVSADEAWTHRVAAAHTADPVLAAQLAQEAEHQAALNRFDRAATLLLWAADLAGDRGQYESYLLAAATHVGFSYTRLHELHDAIADCTPSCRRDTVLGLIAHMRGDLVGAETFLTRALESAHSDTPRGDLVKASNLLARVYVWQGEGRRAVALLRSPPHEQPTPALPVAVAKYRRATLANGTAMADSPAAGLAVLAEAGFTQAARQVAPEDGILLRYRGNLRLGAGQLRAATDDLTTHIAQCQADPGVFRTPLMWWPLSLCDYLLGRWDQAAVNGELAVLAAETNGPAALAPGLATMAMVHANRGLWDQARALLTECEHRAAPYPLFRFFPEVVRAVLARARADQSAISRSAHALAAPPTGDGGWSFYRVLVLPAQVDALTSPGIPHTAENLHLAATALGRLDRLAEPADGAPPPALALTTHWLHARLAAVRGDTITAQERFQHAVDTPVIEGDDIPLHRALAHQDYAQLLQARGDTTAAVPLLQRAREDFIRLGATPFATRVAADLDAAGARTATPARGLTDREDTIARLAVQGLTNQAIGHELYISPKTVEYHLRHVYEKLGINSRRQLRTTLTPT